jgi:hypothetical protein
VERAQLIRLEGLAPRTDVDGLIRGLDLREARLRGEVVSIVGERRAPDAPVAELEAFDLGGGPDSARRCCGASTS